MNKINLFACLLILLVSACNSHDEGDTAKFQEQRNNIINVKGQIVDIKVDILLSATLDFNTNDDFLFVIDINTNGNKGIHLFDKKTLEYKTSTGILGKGPGEISSQGSIGLDNENGILWVQDFGKKLMWKFPIDSVLKNEMYKPKESIELHDNLFLATKFETLNDSIALVMAMQATSNSSFSMTLAKHNFKTNKTEEYGYKHPKAVGNKSHAYSKASKENELYVTGYLYLDLITICNLDGTLKYNIYGPEWMKNKKSYKSYFYNVEIFKSNIIVAYNGDNRVYYDKHKRQRANLQSKLMIFDLEGNYKSTMELGYKFSAYCLDEENDRVIIYFEDRANPLGYINLNLD